MTKTALIAKLRTLVHEFKEINGWSSAEDNIQAHTTIELLKSLGWKSNRYIVNTTQDVKTGKRPDILLLGESGNKLLVIESKDASNKDMLDGSYKDKSFQKQLSDYCNAEGLCWGILTNFIEWRVYNSYQNRLYKNRKYAFHELLWPTANKSEYIDLFSDEGISFLMHLEADCLQNINGRWDNDPIYYPQQEEIKQDFFLKLKSWRSNLRTHIRKLYGDKFIIDDIDLMTQKIIDRLIFIDYCADNSILAQNRLNVILHSRQDKWIELKRMFEEMNDKFNTELFSQSSCDTLKLADEIIIPIVQELSAIDFKQLSVHIIGEVYENYLGEMLKKNRGGVRVEDSKANEKKKSQGIYYTPDYVVNYMVENTVGKILSKCKTAEEIQKIRVLDPSCGSGSFLIRIFDEFKKAYARVNKNQNDLFEFETRKKILQNNIFGVDLDARAVEIAKLNLMIKALEEISWQDIKGRKLLPSLELNIRYGNSLVSGDEIRDESDLFFKDYEATITSLVSLRHKFNTSKSDEDKKAALNDILVNEHIINSKSNESLTAFFKNTTEIKPFNYTAAFPEVFRDGGFDVVIGNPPYLNVELVPKDQKQFFIDKFSTFFKRYDVFALFFDVALLKLTHKQGLVSFIVPQQIFNNLSYKKLRNLILENQWLQEVFYLGDKVFTGANNDVCILFLKKPKVKSITLVNALNFENKIIAEVDSDHFAKYDNIISYTHDNKTEGIFDKILSSKFSRIKDNFDVFQGIVTGNNSAFLPTDDDIKNANIEKSVLLPVLHGRDFEKWSIRTSLRRILYLTGDSDISKYPNAIKWLNNFKNDLSKRRECLSGVIPWYSLQWPRIKKQLDKSPKILVQATRNPRLKKRLVATIDEQGVYGTQGLNFIVAKNDNQSIYFLLGLLNSSLMNYLYATKFLNVAIKAEYLKETPVPNVTDAEVKNIEKLVQKALKTSNEIEIQSIERQINTIVYKLFNLSRDEIETIENT